MTRAIWTAIAVTVMVTVVTTEVSASDVRVEVTATAAEAPTVRVNALLVAHAERRQSVRERIHRLHDRVRVHLHRRHEAHVAQVKRGVTSRLSLSPDLEVLVNLTDGPQSAVYIELLSNVSLPTEAWLVTDGGEPVLLEFAGPGEIIIDELRVAENMEVQVLMADGDALVIWLDEISAGLAD